MKFKKLLSILMLCSLILVFSCQKAEEKKEEVVEQLEKKVEEIKEVPSVCIWDKASVRESPSGKAKWLSSMALGEKVTWLGTTAIDSADKNREFLKIRLSDNTEGWVSVYVLAQDAKPSVAIKEIPIYRRPDLLTFSDKKFQSMEMVAIFKTENNWLEVIGAERKKKGWIQDGMVTTKDEDIAVASFAMKALAGKDTLKIIDEIESIVNNPAFSSSVFIPDLQKKLSELGKQD